MSAREKNIGKSKKRCKTKILRSMDNRQFTRKEMIKNKVETKCKNIRKINN